MSNSFHYLVMAEHSIFQKRLLAKLKGTGLTSGQPKVLDYLKDHDVRKILRTDATLNRAPSLRS